MKTTNAQRREAGTVMLGSFPMKKGHYWNARRRYVAKGHFETYKLLMHTS
ncbi:MAG: hypothetical protein AB3N14_18300 [Flavobacteriaceae bacterium]